MNAFELIALAKEIIAGKRNKKITLAAIEAALTDLKAERDHAQVTLADVVNKRRTALLDGLDDTEIEAIEAEEKALERRLERLDLAEPALLKRLYEARGEVRRDLWKIKVSSVKEARTKYLDAARQAAKAGREFIALRYQISANFQEIGLLEQLPMVGSSMLVDEGILASWEAQTERFFDALPVIDQRRDRAWDGADQPARNLDYRGIAPPRAVMDLPAKKAQLTKSRTMPDDRTFQTVAIVTRNDAQPFTEADLKTGEDGLMAVDFMRRYDYDGAQFQLGPHRVTPAVAMAAMRAGAADLPRTETLKQVGQEEFHG